MPAGPTPLRRQPRLVGYLVAEAASAVGSWALLIALWGVAAYRFDAGPGGTTLIGVCFTLPAVVLGPVAGVLVDRHGARRVLVAAEIVAGLSALSLVLADSFRSLVALSVVHGAAFGTVQPATYALPPQVVDAVDLARTNALVRLTTSLAIVLGPAAGGAAIAAWGFRSVFVVDACSYVLGVAGVLLLRPRPTPAHASGADVAESRTARDASPNRPAASPGVVAAPALAAGSEPRRGTTGLVRTQWAATREGLALARRLPDVRRVLVLNAAVYLLYGACLVYEPLYVRDVLGRSASTFAQLQSAFGVSLLVVGVIALRLADRLADPAVLAASVTGAGAFAGLYLGTRSVTFAFLGVVLWGGGVGLLRPTRLDAAAAGDAATRARPDHGARPDRRRRHQAGRHARRRRGGRAGRSPSRSDHLRRAHVPQWRGRAGGAGAAAPTCSGAGWQRGHQYVERGGRPSSRRSIGVPQRGHGFPRRP